MNNADVFKRVFGIYAEEFWSYTEKQMLDWINADNPDTNVGDMISRQAAIEIIQNLYPGMPRVPLLRKDWAERYEPYIRTEKAIKELPTAPERKTGKWVGTEFDGYADGYPVYYEWKCSACGRIVEDEEPTWNFCPNCGAEMVKGEDDE